ncbi:MAG: cation:proton antiporter [Curtobacterium sp.]
MTELLVVGVIALLAIAGAAVLGPRIGVAAPLVLVAVGIAASLVPWVPDVRIDPEWILAGVLPPLLYSSAVSMPSMNFRREFGAISGLSVLLVVASSVVLGLFFAWVVPGIGIWWGIALGAIVSPTDAVATSIVKQTSVSRRVVSILDGESLLNDATALVLLRTAIAAAAASFSFWGALGDIAWAVAHAAAVGWLVGWANVAVRRRVSSPAINTALSFAVPFVAAVPTEVLGGSGLVAAVVAGLFTGIVGPRRLPPSHRLSDAQNWRTIELVLEGAVFLTMGLQLSGILRDVRVEHVGIGPAVLIAVGALVLTLVVRAAYVVPLLAALSVSARRGARMEERVGEMGRTEDRDAISEMIREHRPGNRQPSERELDRFTVRLRRMLADIAYYRRAPLGWREGTTVVWAGMRGAVTVAAAQTLEPETTPQHALLVLIAFAVAVLSLVLQGGTIGPLLRRIAEPSPDTSASDAAERRRLIELMRAASESVASAREEPPARREELEAADPTELRAWMGREKARRLAVLEAQRRAILDARDDGTFDAEVLEAMLQNLDAEQIALELRGAPAS